MPKKLDYPRFSGDIRDYSTFPCDFNDIISNSGAYFSDNQISLLLRSQLIIKQITSYKEIAENDMAGFVDFVEMIEKAHQDLQAFQSTDVLSNPVNTQAILEKCPYWAQQNITRDMTKMRVSRTMESDFIRLTLIKMKKQARLSSPTRSCGSRKGRSRGARGLST